MSERRYGYADRPWEDEPEEPDPRPPRWQRTSWRVWTLIAVGMLVLAFGEWNERRSASGPVVDTSAQRVDWTGRSSSSASGGSSTSAGSSRALAPEELYLQTIRRTASVAGISDAALLTAGQEVCGALDRGVRPSEILLLAAETSSQGAAVMGTAATILCREHLPAVEDLVRSLG